MVVSLTTRASSSKQVELGQRALAAGDVLEDLVHALGALAAGEALAAGFRPCRKFMKYLATSTMQVFSSMTIMPPEPMIEPAAARLS